MHDQHALTTFVALFAIIHPFGAVPVFLALTANMDARRRRATAFQVAVATLLTLTLAYFVGDSILALFQVDMDAFRIAGGVIIAASAWAMVNGREEVSPEGEKGRNPAIIPLTIPLLAGPGAIAVVIALGNQDSGALIVEDLVVLAAVTILTLGLMLGAVPIARLLGRQGMLIATRVLGLLLLAIAIGSILFSLKDYFPGWSA